MPARRTVYLDHSASTPTDPRVVEAMLPYFTDIYTGSDFAQKAESAIESARETVAKGLNCKPSEIIFTSGGSESDNLAIRGAAWAAREASNRNHLITTPIEHAAVIKTIEQLSDLMGFEHTTLPVNHVGSVSVDDFVASSRGTTSVASVMYANNEVGTVQPIAELGAAAHQRGIWLHTDAVQAAGQLSLDVQSLNVDMMSISAHKFYGPKGVGALYIREGVDILDGDLADSELSNVPLIIGMAKALELAYEEFPSRVVHYQNRRDQLIEGILQRVTDCVLTGDPEKRLPGHASFVIEGIESNLLLMHLDMRGVAASGGSACKTGNPEPAEVLLAMGYSPKEALATLRLTVGRQTTEEDVEYAIDVMVETVEKVRKLSGELVL